MLLQKLLHTVKSEDWKSTPSGRSDEEYAEENRINTGKR